MRCGNYDPRPAYHLVHAATTISALPVHTMSIDFNLQRAQNLLHKMQPVS